MKLRLFAWSSSGSRGGFQADAGRVSVVRHRAHGVTPCWASQSRIEATAPLSVERLTFDVSELGSGIVTRELHMAEALQHRRLHRFKIGSWTLFLHHKPLPRLQEELELPHISRMCKTACIALGR